MEKRLEKILEELKIHSADNLGVGYSEEKISSLEQSLNIIIPDEYRFFLSEIGYAEIFGDQLYSIYSVPDEIPCTGMHWMNKLNKELTNGYIEFFSNDIDGVFYIKEDNGEIYLNSTDYKMANSFVEFLEIILNG